MSRFLYRNLELLEPYEGKLSCTVLRGESSRKGADLPDQKIHKGKYEICFSYFPLKKHASKSPHHLISMIIMRIRSSVYLHPRRCEYRHCPVRPTFRRLWHNR